MLINILIGLAVLVLLIARQFQERPVRFPGILILPALLAYYSYTNIVTELANPLVNPTSVTIGLVVGLLAGCMVGWYRGGLAAMRIELSTGAVFSKASALSLTIWSVFFVVKILTTIALYMGLAHTSMIFALVVATMTALFMGNVLAEKACLLQRAQQYQAPSQERMPPSQLRW